MGFINFYRRFIKGFSKIARVLNELTKKDVPWEWTDEREEAFQTLKRLICEEPVLLMPQLEKQFKLEVDASNYAIGATLNQKDELERWHPVAYYSTTLSETERNYDIYDKELLAVVKSLRHWRTYLAGAPHQIVIHTDHSNLLYWKEPHKISRRIAREFQELQEYNFVLKHVAGNKNARADALSRRPDYDMGEKDNDNVVVLPSQVFIKLASEESIEEIDTCSKINMSNLENEETIRRWANTYQLHQENKNWWKEDALVVASNNNLKRGVISAFHDPPYRGHPGIGNTLTLLKQNYWWPNLKKDIEEYVKGCAACQATKSTCTIRNHDYFPLPQTQKRNHSKWSPWISLQSYHRRKDMTRYSRSPTTTAQKRHYSSHATSQSRVKEWRSYTSNTSTPTTGYPKDLSRTEDRNSYRSSCETSAKS